MATIHTLGCGDHSPYGVKPSTMWATRSSVLEPVGRKAERTAVGGMRRNLLRPVRMSAREPGWSFR